MSVNKIILLGNLGKDPEVRTLESGVKVTSFSLATSDNYNDKNTGEKVEVTDWHNVEAWGKLAEIIEKYLTKGSKIYLEGKLKVQTWEKDGERKYKSFVKMEKLEMLGSKEGESQSPQGAAQGPPPPMDDSKDDLPF